LLKIPYTPLLLDNCC